MYSLQAHDGSVTALTYSASYVISLGTDERLCVWERFQGHLLNTIQVVSIDSEFTFVQLFYVCFLFHDEFVLQFLAVDTIWNSDFMFIVKYKDALNDIHSLYV